MFLQQSLQTKPFALLQAIVKRKDVLWRLWRGYKAVVVD